MALAAGEPESRCHGAEPATCNQHCQCRPDAEQLESSERTRKGQNHLNLADVGFIRHDPAEPLPECYVHDLRFGRGPVPVTGGNIRLVFR